MECCTYRQCSSVIRYTVDGMLHIKAIFVCYMLHSWWNVAHTGNVRLLYATQLTECCTYRQCSSVTCYTVDGMLHIQGMLVCYMLHSWWEVKHTGNVRLLYATQLMECWTYRKCSPVICYTVDGMLHMQAMFVWYMLHSWWNVAHTGNVRLLYATQLMECCTYRKCSPVICYTVDGMLHMQAMFVCYMLHSWWNVAHTGNVRLLYATQLMECCTYRQCSSVISYTVDGMLHIQAMFVCYMLHSWWNVAHTGNARLLYVTQLMECCTCRQCSSAFCYTVDGMLHLQAIFVCYMIHIWWNVPHTGSVRLLYATQLMECSTHRQCSSVICYTVDGMLHMQAMFVCLYATQLMECCTTGNTQFRSAIRFVCYMIHSWWNLAHTGNIRLFDATQLMECCTYKAIFVCYMIATQLMECCTYRQRSSVICLYSWWNVAHTGNVRLLYAAQLMECCTYRQCSSVIATQLMECCT